MAHISRTFKTEDMIFLIGRAPYSGQYVSSEEEASIDFENLIWWLLNQSIVQLDIETTVTKWWCDKQIITIQFGSADGKTQWVVQWSYLTPAQQSGLIALMNERRIQWVIHNAMFECVVFLFYGVRLRNVWCTMLGEAILHCGEFAQEDEDMEGNETDITGGYYSLAQTYWRYFGEVLDKTEQMNFGDDILTESKVLYAAKDVQPLCLIRRDQMMLLDHQDLDWVAALEMEAVLGYAEMTYHGMELDVDKWLANLELALPVQQQAREKLDAELIDPNGPFRKKAIAMGFFDPEDRVTINWNSPSQKKLIVDHFFPPLAGRVGAPALKALLKMDLDPRLMEWVVAFAEQDYKKIEAAIIEQDREWLIANEFITPGGRVTINWGAWQQTLPIFQCHQPKLKSTGAKGAGGMGNFYHPIGNAFREWKDTMKLTSTYGHKFVDEHLEPDGRVRTTFNQILSTGRISSRNPNMQQIPVREPIGTRYRNAFISQPGWGYVSADYVQQELVIIAYLSGEQVWIDALKKKQDLHLVVTEMVYKDEFKKAAEPDCAYFKKMWYHPMNNTWSAEQVPGSRLEQRKEKCKCKKHKVQREPCKNLNFGMAYGLSKYKFAGDMRWSVKRAEEVINAYFKAFPRLKRTLDYLGNFGLWHGYIITVEPFFRKRYFPDWKHYTTEEIQAHIDDIKYDKTLGHMQRASKNMPIQGEALPCQNPVNSVNPKAVKPREYRANTWRVTRFHGRCNDYVVSPNNNPRTKAGDFNEMSYLHPNRVQI